MPFSEKLQNIRLKIEKFKADNQQIQKIQTQISECSNSLKFYENMDIKEMEEKILSIEETMKSRELDFNSKSNELESLSTYLAVAKNNESVNLSISEKLKNINKMYF